MSDVLRFEERRSGRVVALFGVIEVGVISAVEGGRLPYGWVFVLPPGPMRLIGATDVDAAKEALTKRADEWLEAADLVPRGRPLDEVDGEAKHASS